MFMSGRSLVFGALALLLGALALWYGGDTIWVYAWSPGGPFAFHASKATLAAWADSASVTSFPNHTTARFSYEDAAIGATATLELTRLSRGLATPYQCTVIVGGWSTALVLSAERQARPTPASPSPVYPEPARQANLSGQVLGQFVVDTIGLAFNLRR